MRLVEAWLGGDNSGRRLWELHHTVLIQKSNGKSLGIESDDFALAFHLTLIIRERPRNHDVLPDKKLRFALDVSSAGAKVNDFPFEKSAVGRKMRIFGALRSLMPAHLFGF
jgi:hypothetical protein